MHKIESREFQTGNTFPKQYWLAVNGKPIKLYRFRFSNLLPGSLRHFPVAKRPQDEACHRPGRGSARSLRLHPGREPA